MDPGILIARVILGPAIGAHGAQKLFGWFGGHGPRGTGAFFGSFASSNGIELPLITAALLAAFAGTGAYSLDRLALEEPAGRWR
ncbi:MAG TPA: DoxX family membrane protein [Methylomirabilota bacterium]|jgi:putative oxidoreductase|nr:DoxX family membrane protein [Methylomirabilota bacterium]